MHQHTNSSCPRPRLLYSSICAWLALCGGRFTAPFLESEANFNDAQTGLALALQMALFSILASFGGSFADEMNARVKNGRLQVLKIGITLATFIFLLHGVGRYFGKYETMWHFCLRLVYAVASSMIMPVLDGIVLAYLKKMETFGIKADYGNERLHGAIWWAIANALIGPCIDKWGFKVFYVSAVLSSATCLICINFFCKGIMNFEPNVRVCNDITEAKNMCFPSNLNAIPPSSKNTDKVSLFTLLLKMCATLYGASFLFSYFTLNMGISVVVNLIFLYFEFLGGSNTVCGLTVAVTVMFEIPIFHLAPWIMEKMGPGLMQHMACAGYIIRVLGYSVIPQNQILWVLLLEPLHGITYAFSKLSSVEFANRLMPDGYEASGQGLLTVFQGLGYFIGLSGGGWVETIFGPRVMYRGFAATVFVGMLAFAFVDILWSLLQSKTAESRCVNKSQLNERSKLDARNLNEEIKYDSIENIIL